MQIKAVLFDLDGTLLPMDQDIFVKAYFSGLAKRLAPHGYDPEKLIAAIWTGTKAMIKNDGSKTNEAAFWDCFAGIFGEAAKNDEPLFREFYETDFQKIQQVCGFTPDSAAIVSWLKAQGCRVILATNPIFPAIATESRIRWAGMQPENFESYTTYENSRYCKPNPDYYRDILSNAGLQPEECLMVGNDVGDDMIAASLGMQVFLLTDCLINSKNADISQYPQGDFAALRQFLVNIL